VKSRVLHPIVVEAAAGVWPPWVRADAARREHMVRVAELMDRWARVAGVDDDERTRWRALGYLHDALKDEAPETLRGEVPAALTELPDPVLHGPAVAARLRGEGVDDEAFLRALAYHTLGHPALDAAGECLFAADFLEPGRTMENEWRAGLRARMPGQRAEVVGEILRARMAYLLERGRPVRPETLAFWNRMAEGDAWARASEV
jgi:HD superfamily phosphohydrolase YqeK